jgi:hypothetical protein
MIKLLVKLVFGVLIVPLAAGVSMAFYRNIMLVKELGASLDYFMYGIDAYVILHILFYKPTYLYVLGHEAVHAGMAWVMGGKVKSFKVSGEGGSVATDKTNTLIELGPYFVPIYAIIITVVYFIVASSYNISDDTFMFLIGFALAFHIVLTVEVMKIRQSDIAKSGLFFSVIFIYILNIIVMALIFGLLFQSFRLGAFFSDIWWVSKEMYIRVIYQLFF